MKQHLYQQMHAQQRSLRNASAAMHQNFMPPHYDGLPQAALNPGVCHHLCGLLLVSHNHPSRLSSGPCTRFC